MVPVLLPKSTSKKRLVSDETQNLHPGQQTGVLFFSFENRVSLLRLKGVSMGVLLRSLLCVFTPTLREDFWEKNGMILPDAFSFWKADSRKAQERERNFVINDKEKNNHCLFL